MAAEVENRPLPLPVPLARWLFSLFLEGSREGYAVYDAFA